MPETDNKPAQIRARAATASRASKPDPQSIPSRNKHTRVSSELVSVHARYGVYSRTSRSDIASSAPMTSSNHLHRASASLVVNKPSSEEGRLIGTPQVASATLLSQEFEIAPDSHAMGQLASSVTSTIGLGDVEEVDEESEERDGEDSDDDEDHEDEESQADETSLFSEGIRGLNAVATLEDLVDRLLAQPISKPDFRFNDMFLCLYRKFARPSELLSIIVYRFEQLSRNDETQLARISSQLRHLTILGQWASDYPGDFAQPVTRRMLADFVVSITSNRVFAVAAGVLGDCLEAAIEDDDTDWGYCDMDEIVLPLSPWSSTLDQQVSYSSVSLPSLRPDDPGGTSGVASGDQEHIKSPSTSPSIDSPRSSDSGSSSSLSASTGSSQGPTDCLLYSTRKPLSKVEWHQFMAASDEELSNELTRIDLTMFSLIRPRDLMRHVGLSKEQKARCSNLEHVTNMIDHFNHLACWVTNMILLRDKAKHRARAWEKFINVAWVGRMACCSGDSINTCPETSSHE